MKVPAWFRRARRSQTGILYVMVASAVCSAEMHGEPFWAKALVAAFAMSLYFAAWALADVVLSHRSAS